MPVADRARLARLREARRRELADGLQHPVPDVVALGVDLHQRLVDEPRQQVEHRVRVDLVVGGDRLGRGDGEPARERRQASHQHALLRVQQIVAPRDRRLERLLARHRSARATGEEAEAVVEPVGDAPRVHHAHPRGSQLDRERQPVDATADRLHGVAIGVLGREAGPHRARSLDEQLDCGGFGERRDSPRELTTHAERLPARRERVQVGHPRQQRFDDAGRLVEHMLTVVEQQQRIAAA